MTDNENKAFHALETIYDWVDSQLVAVGVCTQCGSCCHFRAYGHRLYASYLEALYLLARQGVPRGRFGDDDCGYQDGRSCSARDARVLGCRTFFCGRDTRKSREVHSRALDAMRRITVELGLPWDYKPLAAHLQTCMTAAPGP